MAPASVIFGGPRILYQGPPFRDSVVSEEENNFCRGKSFWRRYPFPDQSAGNLSFSLQVSGEDDYCETSPVPI